MFKSTLVTLFSLAFSSTAFAAGELRELRAQFRLNEAEWLSAQGMITQLRGFFEESLTVNPYYTNSIYKVYPRDHGPYIDRTLITSKDSKYIDERLKFFLESRAREEETGIKSFETIEEYFEPIYEYNFTQSFQVSIKRAGINSGLDVLNALSQVTLHQEFKGCRVDVSLDKGWETNETRTEWAGQFRGSISVTKLDATTPCVDRHEVSSALVEVLKKNPNLKIEIPTHHGG